MRERKKEVCTHDSVNIYRTYTNIKLRSCTCEPKIYIWDIFMCKHMENAQYTSARAVHRRHRAIHMGDLRKYEVAHAARTAV